VTWRLFTVIWRARAHLRTKFADLPGVTSLPVADDETHSTGRHPIRPVAGRLTPPGVVSAPVSALPPVTAVLSTDHLSPAATGAQQVTQRISNIDYRLAVTEKSMKALVFEVVRLQVGRLLLFQAPCKILQVGRLLLFQATCKILQVGRRLLFQVTCKSNIKVTFVQLRLIWLLCKYNISRRIRLSNEDITLPCFSCI